MLDLDIARLSPEIARIILLRAAESPSLQWQENKNLGAKRSLDAMDDAKLLGVSAPGDEGMAAAVWALLYIWNGWIGEGKMYAQAAPEQERFHITAYCERMQGNAKAAKEYFQKAGESPLYPKLQASALSIIGPGASPDVHRFRKVLEMIQGWEPYAFCDLYMQAVSGQLGTGGVLAVTTLQNREFELLFAHCYQKAVGTDLDKKPAVKAVKRKQEKKRPKASGARGASSASTGRSASGRNSGRAGEKRNCESGSPQDLSGARATTRLKVICPGCRERLIFAASARGEKHKCPKCSEKFLIPAKQKKVPAASSPAAKEAPRGHLRVCCPKCQGIMAFPDSARGQRKNCPQCAAVFIVPHGRARSVPSA